MKEANKKQAKSKQHEQASYVFEQEPFHIFSFDAFAEKQKPAEAGFVLHAAIKRDDELLS
jgi:hypothetical protein